MLVLTRKRGEKIVIGDDIVITLVEIRSPEKVRLGIDAPRDVSVHRAEILERESSSGLRVAEQPAAEEPHE